MREEESLDYHALNAQLNLFDGEGRIQLDSDRKAARMFFLNHVNQNTVFFHSLREKLDYMVEEGYYEEEVLKSYPDEFITRIWDAAYAKKFRFPTFMGAFKYYTSYTLRTRDGKRYLERYEDRVVMTSLYLAEGDQDLAMTMMSEIIDGRFQPATPTFLNAGKKARGELVSCFPAGTKVDTISGQRVIEDIRIGDMVLTEDGKFNPVQALNSRKFNQPLFRLKIVGTPEISVTPEHPFLVRVDNTDERESVHDYGNPNFRWIAAKNLRPLRDQVVMAAPSGVREPKVFELLPYALKMDSKKNGRKPEGYVEVDGFIRYLNQDKKLSKKDVYSRSFIAVKSRVEEDEDLGRFVGYYLAEGHVSVRHKSRRASAVVFTFRSKETDFIDDVKHLSQKLFGITPQVNINNNDNSAKISINNVFVAELMLDICGTGYGAKRLTQDVEHAPLEYIKGILIGAARGDGCCYSGGIILDLVNPDLIHQLKLLATRIGLTPDARYYANQKGNLTGTLRFSGSTANNEDFIFSVGKNLHNYNGVSPYGVNRGTNYAHFHDVVDGKHLALVQSLVKSDSNHDNLVYNIQVRDNPTYSVHGIVVHNCFLLRMEDNMESIARGINSSLQLSKRGGGVALNLTNLRETGAPIKGIENQSSGVIPVMKLLEDSFSYANQLGARQGAGAVYLNAHHPDILRFLDTKRENADEKIRIKTLSLGVVIPDITFELAKKNDDMYLFSPHDVERVYGVPFSEVSVTERYEEMVNDKRIRKKKINARAFFQTLAEIQFESGYPYMMFEDTVNAANPIKGRITMSNLCVHGDTKILTDKGHLAIRSLVGTRQNVWNGEEFSEVEVVQTGTGKRLVRVSLSDGAFLDCTPEHKFYVQTGREDTKVKEVRAGQLNEDQKLIELRTAVIDGSDVLEKAYTNGFYTGGCCLEHPQRGQEPDRIHLHGDERALRERMEHSPEDWTEDYENDRLTSGRVLGLQHKFFVPGAGYRVGSRLDWLAGLLDSDGSVCRDGRGLTVQIGSVNLPFLDEVRLMLQTLGVASRVTLDLEAGRGEMPSDDEDGGSGPCDRRVSHRLLISGKGLRKLLDLGLGCHRLGFGNVSPNRDEEDSVQVVSVVDISGEHDTFCFTEPKRNMGVFNGILTGQCSEILQVSEASTYRENLDYDHVGLDISCNLGSLNIAKAMDGGDLGRTVETAIRGLTAVSEKSDIRSVPSIARGNAESRAIGLGQMNLHGFLARERIHYDSREAVDFTSAYFATVLYHCLRSSNKLAQERGGTFVGFEDSDYASGEFFSKYVTRSWAPETRTVKDLFARFGVEIPTREDWEALRESVMRSGLYNRNLQAVPPTGSISYINNSTSSIHPIVAKVEIRKEGKIGRVYYPAAHMTNDNLEFYRDAYEIGPEAIIDIYAAATEHVDQGLSLTLFFPAEASTRDINKAQIYAWRKGIKTVYYVRLRQAALSGTEVEGCVSCSL